MRTIEKTLYFFLMTLALCMLPACLMEEAPEDVYDDSSSAAHALTCDGDGSQKADSKTEASDECGAESGPVIQGQCFDECGPWEDDGCCSTGEFRQKRTCQHICCDSPSGPCYQSGGILNEYRCVRRFGFTSAYIPCA